MTSNRSVASPGCFFSPARLRSLVAGTLLCAIVLVIPGMIARSGATPDASATPDVSAAPDATAAPHASAAALAEPTSAMTARQTGLSVFYEFFIGGLRLGHIDLRASWDDVTYEIGTQIKTGGLAEALFEGRYATSSQGTFEGRRVSPRRYISDYTTTEDTQYVNLSFNDQEPTALVAKPPYDLRYPVSRDLKLQTVDPLSAYLYLVFGSSRDEAAPCGRSLPIFDGKRRYDFNLRFVKDIRIATGDTHGYRGPGYLCEMRFVQVAGFKPRDRDDRPLPVIRVQVAKIEGGRYLVPVKFIIDTDFGAIVGSAKKVDFGKS